MVDIVLVEAEGVIDEPDTAEAHHASSYASVLKPTAGCPEI
jgi:hypothetical protein